ncbi:aminotransferase class I/II-fold pyridoxal phosphate-dependent enzyme [Pantoea sp. Tr-811]|uniref:aminotransferase class I/II-fold pyridoxal phosphate-dependent enzyme n=1 Tax=Pantoea sp. Tr-811 TaxID=2608361 RepID=UPI001423B8E1|nr:aminotransferase class I/II-fold pyridoxal phosphate-dependent enzyme [Pantoea sp. Tr-811]NIF27539.1 aminotransferase class I/II-fold pyridoxal phosphate-dependent enzyme [Pantoea sp. Tr-811]
MQREFAYQVVYRYLEGLIEDVGQGGPPRLPSLRVLARRLRVSLATVQAAYSLLEHEGRVLSVPKSGYFAQTATRRAAPGLAGRVPVPLLERALFAQERRLARSRLPAGHGLMRLRQALAERYTRSSRQCWQPEEVQVGPDVQAVLETLLAALALQGCTVLVGSPCCWRLLRWLQQAGLRVLEVPEDARGGVDVEAIARVLGQEQVSMLVMPSCLGMPTGRLMARQEQQRLARLLAQQPVWLLENDLDSEHCFTTPRCSRLRDWVDPRWLLVLGSLEAAVGAEAPYGYVLSRQLAVAQAFDRRAFQLAPLRQQALAQMLGKGEIDEALTHVREELRGRMALLCQQVAACLGTQAAFSRPEGGQVLWLKLAQPVPCNLHLAEALGPTLQALPGERFSVQGHYRQYLALSWQGGQLQLLVAALQELAVLLKGAGR